MKKDFERHFSEESQTLKRTFKEMKETLEKIIQQFRAKFEVEGDN